MDTWLICIRAFEFVRVRMQPGPPPAWRLGLVG